MFVARPEFFYHLGRIFIGVIPGTVSLWVLYRLSRRVAGESTALWGTFWLSVNFLHVRNSHYIYVDTLMVLAVLLTVTAALDLLNRSDWGSYLRGAMMLGIATAVKYNAALVAIALVAAHAWNPRRSWRKLAVAGPASVAVFAMLNPFAVLDLRTFLADLMRQSGAEGAIGWSHHVGYSLAGSAGWPMLMLSVLGVWFLIRKRPKEATVLFAFPILFLWKLGVFSQPHERYVLPIVPFACLPAGIAADALLKRWGRRTASRAVILMVLGATVVLPLTKSMLCDWLWTREDTRTQARAWIEANLPTQSRIAFTHSADRPRLIRDEAQWGVDQDRGFSEEADARDLKNRLVREYAGHYPQTYFMYFLSTES
ncbi:MAG: glycosyltransferase family 39 protein, partial [Candidatus Omnitrophica bacterium]|nr:glycosyltransferase family 39 protein [Candidatus Omnitrophota bacterium]